ncbi:MAG TPA: ChaN family lipoprotein [Pyrinomonadaceae bacterium]|nr:ChaN family lipoprotein [Pyrinomonadaceae bacterium]
MKNSFFVFLLVFIMTISTFAQDANEANYRVFDAKGKPASLDKIIEAIAQTDVVFLGENHDDTTAHALQLQIFKAVIEKYGKDRKVALSLEMFERDVQTVVNEYLNNLITENHFLLSARPWNNYKQDYRPLVELAKTDKLPVIAANAPRRYVNMVSRGGRDALNGLSPEAKKWLAPLPYNQASETYGNKFKALMGGSPESNMGLNKILDSQSLWDATMSYSIAEFLKENKKSLVVHLNGAFHTENRLGTAEQLLKYRPKTKILVVTMRYEEDFTKFDAAKHENLGDFVILTDSKVPRSFKQS